jgi:hypothetical protein
MVLSCFLEEHVMYSSVSAWENGAEKWSVIHDCNLGLAHLERTGSLPPEIDRITAEQIAMQESAGGDNAGVDYVFDVPIAAMGYYTGFRHDCANPEIEYSFERLERIRVGFIQRLKSLVQRRQAE